MSEKGPMDHIVELTGKVGELRKAVEGSESERRHARAVQQQILDGLGTIQQRLAAMPDEEHREHHDFIKVLVEDHRQRQALRAAILHKVYAGGAWATVAGISALIWQSLKHKTGGS